MSRLSLALLGPFQAALADRPIRNFRTNKVQALLIYLAVEGGARAEQAHRRDTLMTLLWPDLPLPSAQTNLRQTLHRLRQIVPDVSASDDGEPVPLLVTDRQTVQINPAGDYTVDVQRFVELLAGQPGLEQLQAAVELYRGDFLADFYLPDSSEFEDWAANHRSELRRQVLDALDQLTAGYLSQDDFDRAEAATRRQLELDDLRESAYRQLMTILARSGQRSAALTQYEVCREKLRAELNAEPSPETTTLAAQIRASEIEPVQDRQPVRVSTIRHNLPAQSTPFLGREEELAALNDLLDDPDTRLITILGPGGMGKTRLALTAAERQLTRTMPVANGPSLAEPVFPQGIYFVDLTPLRETKRIIPAIAKALNFHPQLDLDNISLSASKIGSLKQELVDFLRSRRLLLVIDNFEHLLDGASLLSDILKTAPEVQILVTSRERLRLQEEQLYPIHGLPFSNLETLTEAVQYPVVRLFLQSARRVQPDFDLTAADLPPLARICRLVAGMPLGIELAASWVDMLPLAEIADEIKQSLDFLETDLQNIPERHRSVRAVFDYTWQRLEANEQEIFPQLSVFRAGFTRTAAQAITGAPLRLLSKLVSKSLLQYDANRDRYEIHELLRQYGKVRLAEDAASDAAVRIRHSAYFCAWLKDQYEATKGPQLHTAFAAIEADIENIEAAWSWAITNGLIDQIEAAIDGMYRYYERQSRFNDGEAACRTVVSLLTSQETSAAGPVDLVSSRRLKVKALVMQARFHMALGRFEQAEEALGQSEAVLADLAQAGGDHRLVQVFALVQRGFLDANINRYQEAAEKFSQSLALYQALGMEREAAKIYTYLGVVAQQVNEYQQAKDYYQRGLAFFEAQGNQAEVISLLNHLGWLARDLADYGAARGYYEKALALAQASNNPLSVATCLLFLAYLHLFHGEFDAAKVRIEQSLVLSKEVGRSVNVAFGILNLGATCWLAGDAERAFELLEQSERMLRDLEDPYAHGYSIAFLAAIDAYRGHYSAARQLALTALEQGQRVRHRFVVGRANRVLGWIALAEGEYRAAYPFFQESVAAFRAIGEEENIAWSLAPLGLAAYYTGKPGQARAHLYEALQIALKIGAFIPTQFILPAVALLLAEQEEMGLALDIYGLAFSHPFISRSRLFEDVIDRPMARLIAALPADMIEAARAHGQTQDRWEAARTLLATLEKLGWAA